MTAPEETIEDILNLYGWHCSGMDKGIYVDGISKEEALDRINQLMDEVIGPDIKQHRNYCDLNSDLAYYNPSDVSCSCDVEGINKEKAAQRQRLAKLFKGGR